MDIIETIQNNLIAQDWQLKWDWENKSHYYVQEPREKHFPMAEMITTIKKGHNQPTQEIKISKNTGQSGKLEKVREDLKSVHKTLRRNLIDITSKSDFIGYHIVIDQDENHWFDDYSQNESDVPQIGAFVDMGLIEEQEKQRFKMDERDFSEMCTVSFRGGAPRLLAFHMKNSLDYQKPYHLRPEVIQKWFGEDICDWLDANTLSQAWSKLQFDAKTVKGLIFGYFENNRQTWVRGLRKAGFTKAEYFENLANEMDEFDPITLDSYCKEGYEKITRATHPDQVNLDSKAQARWIKAYAQAQWEQHKLSIKLDKEWEKEQTPIFVSYVEDGYKEETDPADHSELEFEDPEFPMGATGGDAVWGAHPLYNGSESLPHEVLVLINHANLDQLNQIKSALYPTYKYDRNGKKIGILKRAKLWMLTDSQVNQTWRYIKDRETAIYTNNIDKCRPEVVELIQEMATSKKSNLGILANKMWAMIKGQSFIDWGQKIQYQKIRNHEAECLRLAYNTVKRG